MGQKPKPITTTPTQHSHMKRVILITGTPCVGKTAIAQQLTAKLDALYINLTEFAEKHQLTLGEDKKRKTTIIDEEKMRKKISETIDTAEKITIIIDGHYAPAVVPKRYATRIFVLRRNPIELRKFMEKSGFRGAKLWENLASEILDVCLVEALREHAKEKVCELDVTGKTVENVTREIIAILDDCKKCLVGCVDWLGMLEKENITDEYLKI
jgi:adenylate kinase